MLPEKCVELGINWEICHANAFLNGATYSLHKQKFSIFSLISVSFEHPINLFSLNFYNINLF